MAERGNDWRFSSPGMNRVASRAGHPARGAPGGVSPGFGEGLPKILYRSRWILLVCVMVALAAGFAYIETTTPIFTSTAKLYLDYGGIPIVPSYEPGRIPRTDRYLYTQAEALVSRPILETVLATDQIRQMRTFTDVDLPVAFLRKNIRVRVGKKDEIISVSFDSPYAFEAQQIVESVVEAYLASRSDREERDSEQFLMNREEEMRRAAKELEDKRQELEDFQTHGMPLALGSDRGSGVMTRYLELETERTRAHARTLEAEVLLSGVRELAEKPAALRQYLTARGQLSTYASASAARGPLETELTRVEQEISALEPELSAGNPKMVALKAAMERISEKLKAVDTEFVEAALLAAGQQYRGAVEYEASVAAQCEAQEQKVQGLNAELRKYQSYNWEVSQLEAHYQDVRQQVTEIRSIVGEEVSQLRMLPMEPAALPREPSYPQKAKIMAAALFLGLLSGSCLAVLRGLLDQTLRSADEISALLGLPILGVIPAMSRRQKINVRGQRIRLQPDSPEAEAFRTVRTAVFFGAPKDKARTMLVTSPTAGDGKSTLASNLAIAMAQAGQKTVLVDADFRKPTQHVIFASNHDDRGMTTVLSGKSKLAEALQSTPVKELSLLPCGPQVSNPAEILNSGRFAEVMHRLAEVYDRVIVDAPPVTVVTDAQILGALCDVTVLVLRADKSTRKVGYRAVDALNGVGARLLGAVVNDVRRSGDRYGYYGGYGGSNGSGRGGEKGTKAGAVQSGVSGRRLAVRVPTPEGSGEDARY